MMKQLLLALALIFACITNVHAARMDFNCEEHQTDDLAALACNIYWEGRNQTKTGMLAIAAVTMWRVADPEFPDTIAGVVWEKRWSKKHGRYYPQFQWTLDGKKDRPFVNEEEKWDDAWNLARIFAVDAEHKARMCPDDPYKPSDGRCQAYETLLLSKFTILESLDPTDGAVMYHASYVNPGWKDDFEFVCQVDTHLFYKK